MKKLFIFLVILLILFSCKIKKEADQTNQNNDEEYTDSFSPPDWENPLSRKAVQSGDKDIGIFIKKDTADPKTRNIMLITEQFIENIKTNNTASLEKILIPSAYHSFILRYPDLSFKENYTLRIEQPSDTSSTLLWVQLKVVFPDKTFVGKIQIDTSGDKFKISDFEDDIFKSLKDYNEKLKK
jgi:hypothetical protein